MTLAAPSPAAVPAVSPSAAAPTYGFAGAGLGQSMAEWRASKPSRASIACSPSPHSQNTQVCRGADVALGGGFYARQVDYTFLDGRLGRISFRSSIDGFNYVTANLKGRFRAPRAVVRDAIKDQWMTRDHVTMRWRNGRSTIVLSDPVANTTQLEVRFTLNTAARQLSEAGRS